MSVTVDRALVEQWLLGKEDEHCEFKEARNNIDSHDLTLSKRFHTFAGQRAQYTRSRGLDRETNKALLLNHLNHHGKGTIEEFEGVLPSLTRNQIHALLKELKKESKTVRTGGRKLGHWEVS